MPLPLVAIVIGGAIKLAAPHVAKFLVKHGFKKASQTAVKGKTQIPKVSSKQAKDIVNKDSQTSFSIGKNPSKKTLEALARKAEELKKKFPKAIQEEEDVLRKIQAENLTKDPELIKKLKSGPRPMKKGGRIKSKKKPKGVGAALRGYGATKRGK